MRWTAPSSKLVRGLAVSGVIALLASCGGPASYASPQDCLLENVGKAQTGAAVPAIQQACDDMFPGLVAQQRNRRIVAQAERDQIMRARNDVTEAEANAAANAAAAVANEPDTAGESP